MTFSLEEQSAKGEWIDHFHLNETIQSDTLANHHQRLTAAGISAAMGLKRSFAGRDWSDLSVRVVRERMFSVHHATVIALQPICKVRSAPPLVLVLVTGDTSELSTSPLCMAVSEDIYHHAGRWLSLYTQYCVSTVKVPTGGWIVVGISRLGTLFECLGMKGFPRPRRPRLLCEDYSAAVMFSAHPHFRVSHSHIIHIDQTAERKMRQTRHRIWGCLNSKQCALVTLEESWSVLKSVSYVLYC